MTCHKYENVLLSAAASNDELDSKLALHLERCSTCRISLRLQRELISRIGAALHAQVNEAPPPGFLARLRIRLSKEPTPQPGPNRVWHAGAAVALFLIATLYPLINARQSSIQQNLQTPAIKVLQDARVEQSAHAGVDSVINSRRHSQRPAIQSAVLRKPEVLVPPDEQKAFSQFVARVARRDAMAQAVVKPAAIRIVDRHTELPQVSSVVIADLQSSRAGQEEWKNQAGSSE